MTAASLDTVQTITSGVVAFFALIAVITILRVILRREDDAWNGLRVGFFVERDRGPKPDDAPSPPGGGPGVSETGRDR